MSNLVINTDPRVEPKFDNYPKHIKSKMDYLRGLVVETADEQSEITALEETLKWGEPSFITKQGSTLRMDWKEKKPDQYALYFKCTSKLIPTIKVVYGDLFNYETTRAIVFGLDEKVPKKELKECIRLALLYHTVKKFPNLGM